MVTSVPIPWLSCSDDRWVRKASRKETRRSRLAALGDRRWKRCERRADAPRASDVVGISRPVILVTRGPPGRPRGHREAAIFESERLAAGQGCNKPIMAPIRNFLSMTATLKTPPMAMQRHGHTSDRMRDPRRWLAPCCLKGVRLRVVIVRAEWREPRERGAARGLGGGRSAARRGAWRRRVVRRALRVGRTEAQDASRERRAQRGRNSLSHIHTDTNTLGEETRTCVCMQGRSPWRSCSLVLLASCFHPL